MSTITNPAEAAAFIRSRPSKSELQQAVWAAEDAGHWSASRILRGAYDHAISGDLSAFLTVFSPDPTGVKRAEYRTGWNIAEDVRMGLPETIQARIDAMRGLIAVKGGE